MNGGEVNLEERDGGVRIPVRARPRSHRNGLAGVHDGRLLVQVTAAPEKGRANTALVRTLANALGSKRSQVTLHAGESSADKVFLVTGMTKQALEAIIEAALAD